MTTQTTARPPSSPTATATTWHSAHIYYYQPDKDALILDAIRPLLHQLRPVVNSAYLVWRASHIPDKGPYKVPSGTKGEKCQNGAESTRLNSRTKPRRW